jgi:outer membrane immunogenic protein
MLMALLDRAAAQSPAPERLWHWTGFYVGAGLGGGAAVQTQTLTDIVFGTLGETPGASGVLATVTAGYDYRINRNVVTGAFVDIDFSNVSNSDFGAISLPFDHRYTASIGARIGYLLTPSTLWYLAGGYSRANFDYALLGAFDFDGIFVGGGVETRLGGSWSLRGEYRYAHYFSQRLMDTCGCGSFDAEADMHTGRIVLVYALSAGSP